MITYGSTTLTSYNTITNIEVYYYKSTSATSLSGGSWSTTKPTWENGKYIWQKIRTTYEGELENGQYYSESDPVNITGQQGATGTAAYSYKLNASDTTITVSKTGVYSTNKITFTATSKQGTGSVNAYAGRFKIETTVNGTTWTTSYTSSGNESSKEFTIPTDIIAIRCSLYQAGGTSTLLDIMTIPILNDDRPIATKTYTGLIGSANDAANASFYFAKIHPDNYTTNYKVKMKVRVTAPEAYAETIDIQFGGYGSSFSSYDSYTTRTGSVGVYYINLYRATQAGISTNHKGHALGVGLRSSSNPTNTSYKRTVIIDILELDGCTIEMLDTAVKYASIDGTGSTNYYGLTEMAVGTTGQNATNNSNTHYTQYSSNVKAGTNGIKGYTLIMKDSENTWSCFYSGAYKKENTGKTAYTGGFMLGKILYSAEAGAQTSDSSLDTYYNYKSGVNTSTIYDAYPVDLRYSTNCASTLTSQRPVYIVGTIENDGLFHLDVSQWWTQTEPTYADGKVYIYVGMAYSSYQVWLSTENPAYMFYNGEFILYDKAQTLQNINTLKESLETQIDSKVETWCQKTNPASSWTAEERPNHTGDLWYYIGESGTTYKNNTTYQYNGETNVWSAYSANPDLFDKIDGKTAIYYGTTSSITSAEEGDYLVDSENDCTYRWNDGAWVLATDYKQVAIDAVEIGGRNLLLNTGGNDVSIIRTAVAQNLGITAQIYNMSEKTMTNGEIHFITTATTAERYCRFLKPTRGSLWGIEPGETYTISFYVKGSIDTSHDIRYRSQYIIDAGWKTITETSFREKVGTNYQKIFFTETVPSNATAYYCSIQVYNGDGTTISDFYIKDIKLEKGNIATDWTPAPEDVEQEISTLRTDLQSQIDEKIQTFYQSTNPASSWTTAELKTAHDGDLWYYTGTTTSTYIKDNVYRYNGSNNTWTVYSASGELFDKVDGKSTIFYGTTSGTYTGVETGDYLVDSTDGSSYRYDGSKWVKVTDYQGAIDAIEIGGRNLLLNTDKFDLHKHSSGWVFNGNEASITATTKSWLQIDLTYNSDMPTADVSSQPNMELLGNGDATLSIEAKCEGEINGLFYFQPVIYGNNNNRKYYLMTNPVPNCINGVTLSNEWKQYSITFPVDYTDTKYWTSDSTQLSYPNTGFGARVYWNSTGTAYFRKPKLERGNKVTDWTPAPEDTQADIDTALAQSIWYATCSTAGATLLKEATITPVTTNFKLGIGTAVNVKFDNTNSGARTSLTLNVNNTGAKNIKFINNNYISDIPGNGYILGGRTYLFIYDGTYWVIQNLNYNTNETNHVLNNFSGKTGELGIWQTGLFMRDDNGTYQNICTNNAGAVTRTAEYTKKANTNGFEIGSSIYFSPSNTYAANANITGAVYASYGAFDSRYSLNAEGASALIAYMPIYLSGTINDVDGLFHLDTVWWTQTPTDPDKVYVLIGGCYDYYHTSSADYWRITLYEQNNWYKYVDGTLVDYSNNLAELAATTATAFIAVDTGNDGIMVHPKNDMSSGWQIGNAIQLFKNGISYIRMWIQDNIPKIRIGDEDKNHIVIDDEAIRLHSETKELATYSTDGITFDPETSYKIGNNNSYISFEDEDNNKKLKIVADSIEFTNKGNLASANIQEQLDNLQGDLETRNQYIKIDTGDAEATPPVSPSITIAASLDGEATNLKLESDKLSFQINGQPTATMTNDKMNIPTASVTNLFMESSEHQKIWVMRENGHLSLKAGK